MATCSEPPKKRAGYGFSYQMDLYVASEDVKQEFLSKIESAKRRLAPRGSPPLDSCELICSLLEKLEAAPVASLSNALAGSGSLATLPMLEN